MSGYLDTSRAFRSRAAVDAFDAEEDTPSPWTDTFAAARALQVREENSNSARSAFFDANQARADAIAERGGDRELALEWSYVHPEIRAEWNAYAAEGDVTRAPTWGYNEIAVEAYRQLERYSSSYPDDVKSDGRLANEFRTRAAELRRAESRTMQRGSGVAAFLGQTVGIFQDPLVLATLPFGAQAGVGRATVAQVAGRTAAVEGTIALATEIPIQAQVLKFKRELEAPWTFADSAVNVLAAGVGGAALGGIIGGGVEGTRQLLQRYRSGRDAGEIPATTEFEAAEGVLENTLAVERENPLRIDDEPLPQAHHQALDRARAQERAGQAVDVRGLTEPFEPDDGVQQVLRRAEDPTDLVDVDPAELAVDARTFQFKSGADAAGVTDTLRDVRRFDRRLAGVSLIWERADGQRFIADGHQRRALALRAREAGQDPEETLLNGFILREVDGVSAADARQMAAIKNMAEGTGSALDAAKILRQVGELGDAMLPPLPPRSALVRQARGLSNLGEEEFLQVVNGVIDERFGAIVGQATPDPALQRAMIEVLNRTRPANETQARSIVDQVKTASTETRTTEDLFGEQTVTESLYLERAQVLDAALREAKKDRAVFGRLIAEEGRITEAGQNRLDTAANQQRIQEATDATTKISRLANAKGPLSEALTEAARTVKAGSKPADAAGDFLAAARRAILEGHSRGRQTGRARSRGEAPATELTPPEPVLGAPLRLADLPPEDAATAARAFIGRQAEQTIEELYEAAEANQARLAAIAERIAGELGEDVELANPGIKQRNTSDEKLARKGKRGAGELTDVIRLGYLVRTPELAAEIIRRLGDELEVLDEGVSATGMGYVDHKALVRFDDGRVGEVQLWDPEIARAKFGRGGEIYESVRSISAEDEAADPALAARVAAAAEDSKDLYASALAAASPEWRRVAMLALPEDMRARVQSFLDAGGSAGAPGNISRNVLRDSSEPDSRISTEGIRDQTDSPRATNRPSTPPSGVSRTTPGRASKLKNRSAIDAPPRRIVRDVADERTGLPAATRTGTVPDEEYAAVMARYQDLVDDLGEQLEVADIVNDEVVLRSAQNAIEELDRLEDTLERIRVCSTPTRSTA